MLPGDSAGRISRTLVDKSGVFQPASSWFSMLTYNLGDEK
jgi:hypothetical protein